MSEVTFVTDDSAGGMIDSKCLQLFDTTAPFCRSSCSRIMATRRMLQNKRTG